MSAAEERVSVLLHDLRDAPAPSGDRLAADVARTARWQRPLRRVLLTATATGGGVLDGVTALLRRRSR